ncbi:MAG: BTAD domain-containing putative transcriptional regulator [Armatimonas sp.]
MSKPSEFRLQLFGSPTGQIAGQELPRLRTRNGYLTLALLVLRAGTPVRRDYLIGNLWPDSGDPEGSYNLRRVLSDLRQSLGPEAHRLIAQGHQSLTWNSQGMEIDVSVFDDAAARWERSVALVDAQEAIGAYRGPLLEGLDAPFVTGERTRREQLYLTLLEALAAHALSQGAPERAMPLLLRAEEIDPLRQSAQRLLYCALAARGDRAAAEQAFRAFRLRLRSETGLEPDEETLQLRGAGFPLAQRGREVSQQSDPQSNLEPELPRVPYVLQPLFGRAAQCELLKNLLTTPSVRLVTLTGLGGIGKTRLAAAAADWGRALFSEGVVFVALAGITSPTLLPDAVWEALSVSGDSTKAILPQLIEALAQKRMLLILDNMEQLLPEGARFAQSLLEALPLLRILVTSRHSLHAASERELAVPPLPTPDSGEGELSRVATFPSVQLFVEKAKTRRADFELTEENAPFVARVCAALDGIPLAIELAAAWCAIVTPREIDSRLQERFRLLTARGGERPERHSSMKVVLEESYRALSPTVQRVFAELSVFQGGWTLEAAEAICTGPDSSSVFEALAELSDTSLILADLSQERTRYRFLETVREYADMLLTGTERESVRQRHREHYHACAQTMKASLNTSRQSAAIDALERDYANVRTALETAERLSDSQPNQFYEFVISLQWFWVLRGGEREMRYWLERAVASEQWRMAPNHGAAPGEIELRAQLREIFASALHYDDRVTYQTARRLFLEAEELYLQIQMPKRAGMVLNCLASVEIKLANHREAESCLKRNLANLAEWGKQTSSPGYDPRGFRIIEAVARHYLGEVYCDWGEYAAAQTQLAQARLLYQDWTNGSLELNEALLAWSIGDLAKAERLFQESLAQRRRIGFLPAQAFCFASLGLIASLRNDPTEARQWHDQAIALLDEQTQAYRVALARLHRGASLVLAGDYDEAEADLAHARRLAHQMQERRLVLECLEFQGDAALLGHGDHNTAILYWAKAAQTRTELEIPLPPVWHSWREARYAEAIAALGEETFHTLWHAALSPSLNTD